MKYTDVLLAIKWTVADIRKAIEKHNNGNPATDEQIDWVIDHIDRVFMQNRSIETGWFHIDSVVEELAV